MHIVDAIIHKVAKQKDTRGHSSTTITPRTESLTIDVYLTQLMQEILRLYARLSPGYGTLGQDPVDYPFTSFLREYADDESIDFIEFTTRTNRRIASAMQGHQFTTTSYPLFIRYNNQWRDWILVAVLKLKDQVSVDDETLDLSSARVFAIQDLREAARIDVQKWQQDDQPYLSFIKRGAGGDSSSEYFRTAMACLNYTDARYHTELALDALREDCAEREFTPEQTIQANEQFHSYCEEKYDRGEPVNLVAFSSQLNDQEPTDFLDYIRENEIEVAETFAPHKATFRKLGRIKKTFRSVSLSFDVDELFNEKVGLANNKKAILISEAPADLISSISMALGYSEDDNE